MPFGHRLSSFTEDPKHASELPLAVPLSEFLEWKQQYAEEQAEWSKMHAEQCRLNASQAGIIERIDAALTAAGKPPVENGIGQAFDVRIMKLASRSAAEQRPSEAVPAEERAQSIVRSLGFQEDGRAGLWTEWIRLAIEEDRAGAPLAAPILAGQVRAEQESGPRDYALEECAALLDSMASQTLCENLPGSTLSPLMHEREEKKALALVYEDLARTIRKKKTPPRDP